MFEKEAEEYVKHWIVDEDDNALMQEAYKDGAEFGYNKAKEDADKMKSQFLELCNLKDMRIDELEKVNEWHYVKDGDLPNTEFGRADVTVAYINAYENPCKRDCCFDGTNFIYWDDRKPVGWKKADIFGKIYAWKYPEKLPELKESE